VNEEATTESDDVAAASTVIRFADEAFKEAIYRPLMTAFAAENPGFRIEYIPLEDARDSNTGEIDLFRLASLADVMVMPRAPAGGESSYFVDLSTRLDEQGLSAADFWPGALAACQGQDAVAALPLRVTPATVYLNRSLLNGAQPAVGWSWEEFAETVRQAGSLEAVYGFVENAGPGELLAPLIADFLPEVGGELDTVALSQAAGWYVDLLRDGLVFSTASAEAGESAKLIEEGRAAMWVESPAQLATRRNTLGESVTVLPYPVAEGEEARTPVTAACVALSAGTNQEQAAWSWLNFLAEHPIIARKWEVPGNMAIADSSGFWEGVDPDAEAAFRYSLDHGRYGTYSENIQAVADTLAASALDESDPQDALAAIGELPTPTPIPTPAAVPTIPSVPDSAPAGAEGTLRFFAPDETLNISQVREIGEVFSGETGLLIEYGNFYTLVRDPQIAHLESFLPAIVSEFDCVAWRGTLPDVFDGQLLPLDDLLAAEYPELLADYEAFTLEQARRDGALYGLPVALHPPAFFYDVNRFERREIAPPASGWTIEDFVDKASQMPLGEGDNAIYGFVPYPTGQVISPYQLLLEAYGAQPFALDADPPAVNFDDPSTIAGVNWLAELVAAGVVAQYDGAHNAGSGNANLMDTIITTGRGTMWSDSVSYAEDRFSWYSASFMMEAAPPPGEQALPAPLMTQIYIPAQSQQVEACLDLSVALSGNENTIIGVPARRSLRDSVSWEGLVGPEHAALYRELVARSTSMPVDHAFSQAVAYWWESALTATFAGADAAAALSQAQERADSYLACVAESGATTYEQFDECALQVDPDYPFFIEQETE
jgi:ABC-type glycerol-3-phosphate transport system substrate-binding protein